MPTARATAPCSFWVGYGQVTFAQDDVVDGDLAVKVLADSSLPFEEIHDPAASAPAPKPRAKKATAPKPETT